MKRSFAIAFLPALLPVFFSCGQRVSGSFEPVGYVRQIIQDTTGHDYKMIRLFHPASSNGSITVIGEPEESIFLSERFLTADRVVNITGRPGTDQLPDFAGETVAAFLDEANAPYSGFLGGREASLREALVREAVFSLDTVSRINTFNADATMPKLPAKVIVLASTLTSSYGHPDVDTLFKMASRKIPVVVPAETMMARAFDEAPKMLNVGVWTDETVLSAGVFQTAFRKRAAASPQVQATLNIFAPDPEGDLGNRFLNYLDKYLRGGTGFPLSVLLLDDYGIDLERLQEVLDEIRRMETPEMVGYNKMLAPDFRFVDITETTLSEVYHLLRARNLFTHNIAYPKLDVYQTAATETGFVLVHSGEGNVASKTLEFVRENTTQASKYYAVQGKH